MLGEKKGRQIWRASDLGSLARVASGHSTRTTTQCNGLAHDHHDDTRNTTMATATSAHRLLTALSAQLDAPSPLAPADVAWREAQLRLALARARHLARSDEDRRWLGELERKATKLVSRELDGCRAMTVEAVAGGHAVMDA